MARRFPCVFSNPFIREEIDPKVLEAWQASLGVKVPFGDLRRTWQKVHCPLINPYGSEDCPYTVEQDGNAFLDAVQTTIAAHPRVPGAYFRVLARSLGAKRADEKPLARDRMRRTDVPDVPQTRPPTGRIERPVRGSGARWQADRQPLPGGPGGARHVPGLDPDVANPRHHPTAAPSQPVGPVLAETQGVRRPRTGWTRIGSMFGSRDDAARQDGGRDERPEDPP